VAHISLVFREMWDATDLDWQFLESRRMKFSSRGIPHLAKNQRDMGHPRLVVETEFETASSHTRSDGRPVEFVSISPEKMPAKARLVLLPEHFSMSLGLLADALAKVALSREMAKKYVLTY
jgi:hypothetical protein